ncbi:MAG: phage tail protein [Povalibacter sp.]
MNASRADQTLISLPFGNMRFRVEIEGLPGAGCVEVIFPEGRIARARASSKDSARYTNLTLRRGLTSSRDWYSWWDQARGPMLRQRKRVGRAIVVSLLNELGEQGHRWLFADATPIAYQLSSLHALGSELVMEMLELKVAGFRLEE